MVPSPEATEPGSPRLEGKGGFLPGLCPHFGPCGGCDALDRPYARQLDAKRAALLDRLRDVPGIDPAVVAPVLPDPHPLHYRNKAILPLARSPRGGVLAGFYRRDTHRIVNLRRCDIQDPALTAVATALREEIARRRLPVGEEKGPAIRHLFLRLGRGTGELMVALVTRGGLLPEAAALAEVAERAAVLARDARGRPVRLVSFLRNLNSHPGNRVLGTRTVPLRGPAWIVDRLGRWRLRVSLGSFYQVNPAMTLRALRLARDLLGRRPVPTRIVDGYCGIGLLAFALADRGKEVVGIERVGEAVADARWNARANRLENVRFLEATVEDALAAELHREDLLILDPPRAGCSEAVRAAVLGAVPQSILYVSCHPRFLARDLAALAAEYAIVAVRPLDFFPHTDHLEILVLLRRHGRAPT